MPKTKTNLAPPGSTIRSVRWVPGKDDLSANGFQNVSRIDGDKQEVTLRRGGRRSNGANNNNDNKAKTGKAEETRVLQGRENLCKGIKTNENDTSLKSKSRTGRGACKGPGKNEPESSLVTSKKPTEVICLSDSEQSEHSEEIDVDMGPGTYMHLLKAGKIQKIGSKRVSKLSKHANDKVAITAPSSTSASSTSASSTSASSTSASSTSTSSTSASSTSASSTSTSSTSAKESLVDNTKTPPPKLSIEEYYKSKGMTLSYVRRINRNYVRYDGLPGEVKRGVVFWDSYVPPPGYTMDDLPDSQESSQPEEPPAPTISPAILAAERYKLRRKQNRIVLPKPTDAEFEDLIQRLTKRKVYDNDGEVVNPNPTKRSTPEPEKITVISDMPEQIPSTSGQGETFNSTFPNIEDDLNDSALILCSQQVEMQYNQGKDTEVNGVAAGISKTPTELSDIGKYEDFKPQDNNLNCPVVSSTPINDEFVIRKRNITPETPVGHVNNKDQSENSSTMSLFENSADAVQPNSSNSRRQSSNVPKPVAKKDLFKAKPEPKPMNTKAVKSPKVTGDFMDDDDDELFSQVEMPILNEPVSESKSKGMKKNGMQNDLANMPTQIIGVAENLASKFNLQADQCCSVPHSVEKDCLNDGVKVRKRSSAFKLFKKFEVELTELNKSENGTTRTLRSRKSTGRVY